MSDAADLLAAIRQSPDDDAPRLVYADWLEEHGQPERAEFIRVQCELARRQSPALGRREAELLAARHDAFAGPLAAPGLRFKFERGFAVGFGHTGLFVHNLLRDRFPICSYLLRFHPDGLVQSSFTHRAHANDQFDLKRNAADLFAEHGRPRRGTYSLSAFDPPAELQFTCTSVHGSVDYRGVFNGPTMHLIGRDRTTDECFRRLYTHVPLDGFDSLPET